MKFLASFLVYMIWSSSIFAQTPSQDNGGTLVRQDEFRDVASDLRCPTCTGLSVLDSDAPFSIQIKNEVREQIEAGKQKKEILKFFTDRYGPWILREPPKEGVNLWAWLLPFILLFCGPIIIWYFVWNKKESNESLGFEREYQPPAMEVIISQMNARLADLRRMKKDLR